MRITGRMCLHADLMKYYYDCATEHDPDVPDRAIRHIRQCAFCLAQIHRLKEGLAETRRAGLRRGPMDRDIIDTLNSHFHLLGEPVTCSQVKPFLPGLLDPSRRIRIPTPITVHLDHCLQCAEALSTLRGLDLDSEQLRRLEELYAQEAGDDALSCRRARSKIPAFAGASLEGIDGEILRHFSTCTSCRELIYRHREKLMEVQVEENADGPASCDGISEADVFDYVVPYGLSEAGGRGRPTGAHVRGCRRCLEKIQALHRAIYQIVERADSDIATIYNTIEEDKEVPRVDDPYPGYPVDVQVIRGEPETVAPLRFRSAAVAASVRRAVARPGVRRLLVAAAVMAIALPLVLLFVSTPTSSGITLGQVVNAFAAAENVHVKKIYPGTGEVVQEFLLSHKSDVLLISSANRWTLYDFEADEKLQAGAPGESYVVSELGGKERDGAREIQGRLLGFSVDDAGQGAIWRRIGGDESGATGLYELIPGQESLKGHRVLNRWEVRIDTASRLPQSVVFRADFGTSEWREISTGIFEYPTWSQFEAAIEEITSR